MNGWWKMKHNLVGMKNCRNSWRKNWSSEVQLRTNCNAGSTLGRTVREQLGNIVSTLEAVNISLTNYKQLQACSFWLQSVCCRSCSYTHLTINNNMWQKFVPRISCIFTNKGNSIERKGERRCWQGKCYKTGCNYGGTSLLNILLKGEIGFKIFTIMSYEDCVKFLSLIGVQILRKDTNFGILVSGRERLLV